MLNLLPGLKFLFLQFLPGFLFLLCNLLFWVRDNLLPSRKGHFAVGGTARVRLHRPMSSVSSVPHLGSFVRLDVLDDRSPHLNSLHF